MFSAVGVFTAFLTTWLFLPFLVRQSPRESPVLQRIASELLRLVQWWHAHPTRGYVVVVVALGFSALGIAKLTWQDNLSTLTQPDKSVVEQDARVRARLTGLDTSRVVLAVGRDEQEALKVNEGLWPVLNQAVAAHELDGFQSIATLLPSADTQTQVERLVRSANLEARLPKFLEREKFRRPSVRTLLPISEATEFDSLGLFRASEFSGVWVGAFVSRAIGRARTANRNPDVLAQGA